MKSTSAVIEKLVRPALRVYHLVVPPRVDREIRRALALDQTEFPRAIRLPPKYGRSMTERVVEILIAHLTYQPGKQILDVGHSNITSAHARMLKSLPRPLHITGIDIVRAPESISALYTRSEVADITESPFSDQTFDIIWCISALEHFGMDNSLYADRFVREESMDAKALQEMLRIVRIGGTIYVSVPYGKYEDHGWLRNYDRERWQRLLTLVRPVATIDELYFKYSSDDGWRTAEPTELINTGYYDHDNRGASGIAVALIHRVS